MNKKKKNEQQKVKNLQDAVKRKIEKAGYRYSKVYILDDENAIVFVGRYDYNVMIHYSMHYGNLSEVTVTPIRNSHGRQLKKQKLFMLMKNNCDGNNYCVAVYDYEHGKFVVKDGIFDNIGYDAAMNIIEQDMPYTDYLKQHNCFLAYFSLMSDLDEYIQYRSPINGEYYFYEFGTPKETYYAFVNVDGTIRGNRLFKGDSLIKIEKTIDLRQYGSLEEFKTQRRMELNEISEQNKKAYYDKIGTGDFGYSSPYLDEEVIKVMSLSK